MIEERYRLICDVCCFWAKPKEGFDTRAEAIEEALRRRWYVQHHYHVCPRCQTDEQREKVAAYMRTKREQGR